MILLFFYYQHLGTITIWKTAYWSHVLKILFYIFKIIEQKMAMNRKSSCNECPEANQKPSSDNSQDWVCVKCNNLNFSFRKKCNRCKVQSREDNQQAYLDYYYYNHYYHYQPFSHKQNNLNMDQKVINSHPTLPLTVVTPIKKIFTSESDIRQKQNTNLPSVSPLVKKYKDGEFRKRKEPSKSSWKGQPIGKLFGEEIWNSEFEEIDLKSAEKELSATDDEESREEFIRSVEKMII